jgi:hypothetical protein
MRLFATSAIFDRDCPATLPSPVVGERPVTTFRKWGFIMRLHRTVFASFCFVAFCFTTASNCLGQASLTGANSAAVVPASRADDPGAPPASQSAATDSGIFWRKEPPAERDAQFHRGMIEFTLGGEGYTAMGRRDNVDTLAFLTVGVGCYLAKNLSLNIECEIAPGTATSGHQRTQDNFTGDDSSDDSSDWWDGSLRLRAIGGEAIVRDRFFVRGAFSAYVDAGAGVLHTRGGFPTGNRADSLLLGVGVGAAYRLSEQCYFSAGVRYAHLSGIDVVATSTHGAFEGVQYYGMFSLAW